LTFLSSAPKFRSELRYFMSAGVLSLIIITLVLSGLVGRSMLNKAHSGKQPPIGDNPEAEVINGKNASPPYHQIIVIFAFISCVAAFVLLTILCLTKSSTLGRLPFLIFGFCLLLGYGYTIVKGRPYFSPRKNNVRHS